MDTNRLQTTLTGAEEHWAEVAGHRMRYLRAGSGPPLLMIAGLLGYSFSWRFNISELGELRTVYAPDLLGTGFSDRPANLDCSALACAQRVLEFMDRTGIDSTDLLGTSHGGSIAVTIATMAPSRVRKLILVAPVNPWSAHGLWITRVLATRFGRASFEKLTPTIEAMGRVWLRRLYGDPRRIQPGTIEGYKAPLATSGTWQYGLGIIGCWHDDLRELAKLYPQISQPTLLLWGDRDLAVFTKSAKEVLKRIKSARLTVFPGVGHLPYEEVPEEFNRAVSDFLLN
jgi:pimeloyl-ACP methyl ester carboxylesterase